MIEQIPNTPISLLIVDDEITNRILARTYLSNLELEIQEASNGQEALDIISNSVPDLILLDIRMPLMNGFDLLEDLNRNQHIRHISVIVMTAITETEYLQRAFELGAVDFVNKPFEKIELISRVKNQIGLRYYQKQLIENEKLKTAIAIGGAVAHEMAQPLFAITMLIDLYRERYGQHDIVQRISIQTQRLNQLIAKFSNIKQLITKSYLDSTIVDIQQSAYPDEDIPEDYPHSFTVLLSIQSPSLLNQITNQLKFLRHSFVSINSIDDLDGFLSDDTIPIVFLVEYPLPDPHSTLLHRIRNLPNRTRILYFLNDTQSFPPEWQRLQDVLIQMPVDNATLYHRLQDLAE